MLIRLRPRRQAHRLAGIGALIVVLLVASCGSNGSTPVTASDTPSGSGDELAPITEDDPTGPAEAFDPENRDPATYCEAWSAFSAHWTVRVDDDPTPEELLEELSTQSAALAANAAEVVAEEAREVAVLVERAAGVSEELAELRESSEPDDGPTDAQVDALEAELDALATRLGETLVDPLGVHAHRTCTNAVDPAFLMTCPVVGVTGESSTAGSPIVADAEADATERFDSRSELIDEARTRDLDDGGFEVAWIDDEGTTRVILHYAPVPDGDGWQQPITWDC